jgi:hypothetical protein
LFIRPLFQISLDKGRKEDMLKLNLGVDDRFLHDELANCTAALKLDSELLADGTFHIRKSGNASDCAIVASGKLDTKKTVISPEHIIATLTADVTRRVAFPKGVATVDTGMKATEAEVKGTPAHDEEPEVPALWTFSAGVTADLSAAGTLTLTRAVATEAAVVDVTISNVTVATGACEDELCNGKFYLNKVGNIHVNALCNWERYADLKRNGTHFLIRAVDPHTKVITLEEG